MLANSGIPVEVWSGAAATQELHTTIRTFAEESNKVSHRMLQLTWAIVFLTLVMLIAVGVQIYFALPES